MRYYYRTTSWFQDRDPIPPNPSGVPESAKTMWRLIHVSELASAGNCAVCGTWELAFEDNQVVASWEKELES